MNIAITSNRYFLKLNQTAALLALATVFPACSYTGMTVSSYDGVSGTASTKNYGGIYLDGAWQIPGKLGAFVQLDQQKKVVPAMHELQRGLGALGPSDPIAGGKLRMFVSNVDSKPHTFRPVESRMGSVGYTAQSRETECQIAPGENVEFALGDFVISNYGTAVTVTVAVSVDGGKPVAREYVLRRQTDADAARWYEWTKARGPAPYPWLGNAAR